MSPAAAESAPTDPTAPTLRVNEIFFSIQGESTYAGRPCLFIRLTGCHLRCVYCDTEYAFHEGRRRTLDQIEAELTRLAPACRLVEVTGGEPLLQSSVHPLMTRLADRGYTILLETSGACDITACDRRVIRILDLKTPASGEQRRNDLANLDHLTPQDQVKFVIAGRADFDFARDLILRHALADRVAAVLLSPVHEVAPGAELPGCEGLHPRELAEWLLADRDLAARPNIHLQTQLHKHIWDPAMRGV